VSILIVSDYSSSKAFLPGFSQGNHTLKRVSKYNRELTIIVFISPASSILAGIRPLQKSGGFWGWKAGLLSDIAMKKIQ
jgi:hypothetical protein